jgi:endonuclease YncB( thermonuclease family)
MNILIYIIFVFSGSSLAAAQNQLSKLVKYSFFSQFHHIKNIHAINKKSKAVVKVYDGDTFTGAFSHGTLKIRLLCVDAPELSYSPWGPNAQNRLL